MRFFFGEYERVVRFDEQAPTKILVTISTPEGLIPEEDHLISSYPGGESYVEPTHVHTNVKIYEIIPDASREIVIHTPRIKQWMFRVRTQNIHRDSFGHNLFLRSDPEGRMHVIVAATNTGASGFRFEVPDTYMHTERNRGRPMTSWERLLCDPV